MSTSHRICETCVYCSFAGNCDRHDKPLISIEQPACDAYEIHPLLAENAKLRELVRDMADAIVDWYDLIDVAFACESVYGDEKFAPLFDRMRELGVEP